MRKRIFLAIPIPPSMHLQLTQYQSLYFIPHINWVPKENFHITVSFLGEVEEEIIPHLITTIQSVIHKTHPFTLTFANMSFAPPSGEKHMIWACFSPHEMFNSLVKEVEEKVGTFLLIPNYRRFHSPIPHITLARFSNTTLPDNVLIYKKVIPDLAVTSFQLIESQLTPNGPRYTLIHTFMSTTDA